MRQKEFRVALVTGGSGDIGREICRHLAQDGWKVAVHYCHSRRSAESLSKEIGGLMVRADMTRPVEADRMIRQVIEKWGRLDAVINTAGLPITRETQAFWDAAFEKTETVMYRKAFEIDTLGTIHCIRAALPVMKKRRYGKIVNIVSTPAVNGHDKGYPFTAAKGAVLSLTKSIALELARYNISVNALALGTIETHWMKLYNPSLKKRRAREIPMGRIGKPEDVARVVSFLVSPGTNWMTGQVLVVDGGEVRP